MKVKSGSSKKKKKIKAAHELIIKLLIAPFRALCKATDFYFKTLMDCQGSATGGYGMAVNCHAQMVTVTVPTTTSNINNNGHYYVRKRRRRHKEKEDRDDDQMMRFRLIEKSNNCKRSYSFEIGKMGMIDEDRSCSFRKVDDDDIL